MLKMTLVLEEVALPQESSLGLQVSLVGIAETERLRCWHESV